MFTINGKDKKNKLNHNTDINDETKNENNSKNTNEDKDKCENDKNENKENKENKEENEKKKNDTNRIIQEYINTDNNNKNSLGLSKEKKNRTITAEMVMKNLLNSKRYNSYETMKENNDSKNNNSNDEQKKSIQEYFNQNNTNNSRDNTSQEKDSYNMLLKDKPIKLIENNNNNIINYDLGTINVMINCENPIIADFSLFGPKNIDFFKKYDILKFQSLDILDTINADLNNDIYGYLVNDNFNRRYLILASYLNFYENRVYFYRNDNLGICIYIFRKGKLKNSILQKCGRKIEESKIC